MSGSPIDPWYGCLATQHHLGPHGFQSVVDFAGSPRAVYSLSPEELREATPRLGEPNRATILQGPDFQAWEALVRTCEKLGVRIVTPGCPGYPAVLEQLSPPPHILYVLGQWLPRDVRAVAMVGTRDPSEYGQKAAYTLSRDLADSGYTVVSGLAKGIDTASHEGALAARGSDGSGGRTIAVIGCGIDMAYPPENEALRDRITARGAVISEHPPGTEPLRIHFPRRNRLVSALSQATVVVEAGERSGALITAEEARKQGRPTFVVPGSIFNDRTKGGLALLRAGAAVAGSARDVIAVVEGMEAPVRAKQATHPELLATGIHAPLPASKRARRVASATLVPIAAQTDDPVLRLWSGDEACGLDTLAARAVAASLWPADRAAAALLESLLLLEMRGAIVRLPGAVYRRAGG